MVDASLNIFVKKTLALLSICIVLYLAFLARTPLVWVGIAAFLAVAINPIVHCLQRFMPKKSIGLATFLLIAIFCGVSLILAWGLFTPIAQQAANLAANLPELTAKAEQMIAELPWADSIKTNANQIAGSFSQLSGVVVSLVSSAIEIVVAFVTIIALMFFMTLEGKSIKRTAARLVPLNMRNDVSELGSKIYGIINGYVVGNFLLSMMYGVASGLLLWMLGNPYFLILGLIAGLLDLIPLVGSTIAAILIAALAIFSGQAWLAAIFVVFTIIYVQLENAVFNPLVYSKKVDISPLTVLIAVLIGAAIAGVLGTLLAIPVAATIKETGKVLLKYRDLEA